MLAMAVSFTWKPPSRIFLYLNGQNWVLWPCWAGVVAGRSDYLASQP